MAKPPRIKPLTPEGLGARVGGGHTDALRRESEKITRKIDGAYEKLASKLRGKAEKAKASMEAKKEGPKRDLLRRRFELYANAVSDLEMRLDLRAGSPDSD